MSSVPGKSLRIEQLLNEPGICVGCRARCNQAVYAVAAVPFEGYS